MADQAPASDPTITEGNTGNGNGNGKQPLPPPPAGSEAINLTFRDATGFECALKLKRHTKLGKAMDAFSARTERNVQQLRFLFEGERINAQDTAETKGLADGDIVEVFFEQIGGAPLTAANGEDEWVMVDEYAGNENAYIQKLLLEKEELEKCLAHTKEVKKKNTSAEKPAASQTLIITIHDSQGPINFKYKRGSKLRKVMEAWCQRTNMEMGHTCFFYNDRVLRAYETADSCGMKDGSSVRAMYAAEKINLDG